MSEARFFYKNSHAILTRKCASVNINVWNAPLFCSQIRCCHFTWYPEINWVWSSSSATELNVYPGDNIGFLVYSASCVSLTEVLFLLSLGCYLTLHSHLERGLIFSVFVLCVLSLCSVFCVLLGTNMADNARRTQEVPRNVGRKCRPLSSVRRSGEPKVQNVRRTPEWRAQKNRAGNDKN